MSARWLRACASGELLPGETTVAWDGDTPILVVNIDGDVIEGRKRQQGLTEYLGLRPEGAMDIGHIDPSRGGDVAQAGVGIGHPREKQHRRCKNAFFPGCLPRHAVGRVG